MAQLKVSELDNLIKRKIQEKGLLNDISEEQFNEIKEKIKNAARVRADETMAFNEEEAAGNVVLDIPKQEVTPQAITQTTTVDNTQIELAKKEGELKTKEEEISNEQANLANRESELQRKEDELKYKPIIPAVLQNLGSEKMFVFDTNELSLGGEALSSAKLRLMSNPDIRKSINDIWACEGRKDAEVYVVKFEKIGDIVFNPFEGTSTFEEKRFESAENLANVPQDGMTPSDAIKSQEPTENMIDAVTPISNAVLPPSTDMGLKTVDIEKIVKDRVDSILRNHYNDTFPKL